MQDFINFNKNVHKLSKCNHNDCEVEHFLEQIGEKIFDEELSYEQRRVFFTEASINNVPVFNTMFNLHHKGKENVNKIEDLIEDPSAFWRAK